IDLDGFKTVNDTHGHEAGDHVLKVVAARLGSAMRESDTAARIGGDEFILILGDIAHAEEVAGIATRLLAEVARPIPYENQELRVGCSIGIALYPDHAADATALRKAADGAMYAVKRAGKCGFQLASNHVQG
ncbi:MAG: GGDEF domain-containing protein, partial [Betaproteobacteria bacterium]|nr:GGDEF domain-containing protein [Betaproteobacteria bacterium]